jgi:hypothetical protein
MNLERLYPFWFVLCAIAGAIIGSLTGHGAITGLTGGMLIAALPLLALGLAHLMMTLWRPILPTCRCLKSNHKGYRYVEPADGLASGRSVRFGCAKCGRVYELAHDRFNELATDGRTVPYMHHTKWGRWKETSAGSPPAGNVAKRG